MSKLQLPQIVKIDCPYWTSTVLSIYTGPKEWTAGTEFYIFPPSKWNDLTYFPPSRVTLLFATLSLFY